MSLNETRESGFTLLELMVALALAAVISLLISVVGTQAQNLYKATTSKVEVYQKFRYALADIQEHLENAQVTTDLEFFVDDLAEANGHWDQGEEIKQPANLDGGTPGTYDEGAHIIERVYRIDRGGFDEEHDDFSIYFKAPMEIEGAIRMANIEYFLARTKDDDSLGDGEDAFERIPSEIADVTASHEFVLLKVIRYVDLDASDFYNQKLTVVTKTLELCQNVTDLKFEYYYDSPYDNRSGGYFTPSSERDLFGSDRNMEVPIEAVLARHGGGKKKQFLYGGYRTFGRRSQGIAALADRNADRSVFKPVYFSLGTGSAVKFSQLGYGDNIYIWANLGQSQFPNGNYTVFSNDSGRLEFAQDIDSSTWRGAAGNLRYRAGYLPTSFRVTMRVLNDGGKEPRMHSVVVYPFRKL